MTELDLYKFINDNSIEWHWRENDTTNSQDVMIFPFFSDMEEFAKLIDSRRLCDEDGIVIVMRQNYFAIWMQSICERHDIELERVFPKTEER